MLLSPIVKIVLQDVTILTILLYCPQVEEQPRKLEYVIKVAHVCLHRGESVNALTAEQYQEQVSFLPFNDFVHVHIDMSFLGMVNAVKYTEYWSNLWNEGAAFGLRQSIAVIPRKNTLVVSDPRFESPSYRRN